MSQVLKPEWRRLCQTFSQGYRELLEIHLPDLLVECSQLRSMPTHMDPLGSKARMMLSVETGYPVHLLKLSIDGEETPWLEPHALQMYALVQWPNLFRMRTP